jgi:hypothetical protein
LRVAADAVKAAGDEPVRAAIGVAEAEIEIAADGDRKAGDADWHRDDQARPIEERRCVPVENGDHEGRHHAAAEQTPEGQALPTAWSRRRPDAKAWNEERPQQKKIEDETGESA